MTYTVNGNSFDEEPHPGPVPAHIRALVGTSRRQKGLRRRRLRSLHGVARRRSHTQLHHTGIPGRGPRGHHDRGPRHAREDAPDAAAVPGRPRIPVRLLHCRHDHDVGERRGGGHRRVHHGHRDGRHAAPQGAALAHAHARMVSIDKSAALAVPRKRYSTAIHTDHLVARDLRSRGGDGRRRTPTAQLRRSLRPRQGSQHSARVARRNRRRRSRFRRKPTLSTKPPTSPRGCSTRTSRPTDRSPGWKTAGSTFARHLSPRRSPS